MRPSRITSTAAPGAFSDFKLAKIAATSLAEGSGDADVVVSDARINPKTNPNQRIMRPPARKACESYSKRRAQCGRGVWLQLRRSFRFLPFYHPKAAVAKNLTA